MQLQSVLYLCLIQILVSYSKGNDWRINVTRSFNVTKGSNLTIPCSFSYPSKYQTNDVQVYWKTRGRSECSKNDNDKNAFVFHPNETCVLPKYKGQTKVIGDKDGGNCSLQIRNITNNEPYIYLRIFVKNQNYSFTKNNVKISVQGAVIQTPDPTRSVVFTSETPTTTPNIVAGDNGHLNIYLTIFIPVLALTLIVFITGIVFYIKRKRSNTLNREESGFYVNFNKASSDPPTRGREESYKTGVLPSEQKTIDEPTYVNVQELTDGMGQHLDYIDDVYVNVDYSK
ncbi:uncharacterized protein LOC133428860 [Cololabis saira]|uniref:uncharacterized protein LOC133428860 n=1 Tax=Cololabis saira TaxID=129043 RepID=UPI002AD2F802|nr:uncharacterized protein LOC133428860 [Cololabis saira]